MTDILQMSRDGAKFYPQTHVQAVLGLPDFSGFQTQAIFKTGDYKLTTCPQGTDFGAFLKSDSVPIGFSIIRDDNSNSNMNWRIIKEDSNYIYGLSQDMGHDVYHLEVVDGTYSGYKKIINQSDLSGFQKASDVQTAISTAINGIKPTDLSNYPTKSDVTTEISTAVSGIKPTDLSNYPTKTEMTTEISTAVSGIKPTDLSNYPTKSDVTTEISTAVSGIKPEFDFNVVGEIADNLLLKTDVPFSVTGNNVNNQTQPMYSLSKRLEAGTIVTLSFDAVATAPANFMVQNDGTDGGSWLNYITDTVGTTKKHYVGTITLDSFTSKDVEIRLDNVPSTTTITVSNMKLELGSNETSYSVSPEDTNQTMNDSIRTKLQNMNKEMGS